jgi:NAD(P)-dependent dehydrogenase (short-subunit alcohol dehydrogenase family)
VRNEDPAGSPAQPLARQAGIITGAARGLGLAISLRLARDGMHVIMIDKDADEVGLAAKQLRDEGLSAEAIAADATVPIQVTASVSTAIAAHGQIHALVNNCGIYPYVPFEDVDIEFWRMIFAVNVESTFLYTRAVYDNMKQHGYGRIVNFASGVVLNGDGGPAYVATKAANMGLTRGLAHEAGAHGITVNTIAPGLIDTPGLRSLGYRSEVLFAAVVGRQAIKRKGAPRDIADAVAYIVSPQAGFLTGQMINVNGGDRFH